MQSGIRSILVLFSLGFFTVASAQLPPKIMADKHLIHAEQLYAAKDYAEAFKVMEKVIALQQEHNLTLSDEFHFKYAQVALAADSTRIALESVTRYLSTTGGEGQFYKEALALLLKAEGHEVKAVKDFYNEVIKTEGTCEGLPKGSKCWQELTNHPECYVWNDYLSEGRTVIWTGQCSGHLPDGKGTLTWYHIYEDNDSKQKKQGKAQVDIGNFQKGKRQGHWTEHNYLRGGERIFETREGSYVDDKRHGKWVTREEDGGVIESSYVDGKLHGHYVSRYPDGSIYSEGSYLDGKKQGKWVVERGEDGRYTSEGSFVDDKRHGHWVIRYLNGILGGGSYDADGNKHGEWMEEDCRGRYVNGKKEGTWWNYYEGECWARNYKDGSSSDWKVDEVICRRAGLIP